MEIILGISLGGFLAFANGANDNFKGVATLYGSQTLAHKQALVLATVATFLGSIASIFLADTLLKAFQGKGLVAEATLAVDGFMLAVGAGSALTVMFAARLGIPISTTHSIIGSLAGTAFIADPTGLNLSRLGSGYFMPLLISPLLAVLATALLYPLLRRLRLKLNIDRDSCLCIDGRPLATANLKPIPVTTGVTAFTQSQGKAVPALQFATTAVCRDVYTGDIAGINAESTLNVMHILSAATVSFARGLNDTPKIAAILLAGSAVSPMVALTGVAVFIALGGIISSRQVAVTMAKKVTKMNSGQGFTANLVSGILIIGASRLGMPVSTTHVSVGSLFGLGAVTRQANWKPVTKIVLSWVATLPVAALMSIIAFQLVAFLS